MAAFEPFEPAPHIAVAVSGGADSLALTLLADHWVRARGGTLTGLTVDHGLRAASASEGAQVGAWLAARCIDHRCLVWGGPKPQRGIQAAARAARYRLLEGWCGQAGVLHLLIAHHREDQAETVLLRLARGSGLDGLAGMAAAVEREACRILRPLLGVSQGRLPATLKAVGQEWVEDPSNGDRTYARVRLRQGMRTLLAEEGLTAERLAETAAHLGRARAALEASVAELLARAIAVHPAGFVRLDAAMLAAAPKEIGLRALSAVLAMVGGADYPPRLERLVRLHGQLTGGLGGGRTLGGCRVLPRRGGVLICREPSAIAPPMPAPPGETVSWDGRFRMRLPATATQGLMLGALGSTVLEAAERLPAAVRASLPALRDHKEVVAVPPLRYVRDGFDGDLWLSGRAAYTLLLRPTRPLTGAGFTVV